MSSEQDSVGCEIEIVGCATQAKAEQTAEREASQSVDDLSDFVLSALLGLELDVAVSVGRSKLEVEKVLRAGPGTSIKLNKAVGDTAELLVHGRAVARGEVVVVEGRYGFKITEVVSVGDRLRLCQV